MIHQFTELDAYALPNAQQMVRNISQYKHFSILPISRENKQKDTGLEADDVFWEFTRVPNGVTNSVSKS